VGRGKPTVVEQRDYSKLAVLHPVEDTGRPTHYVEVGQRVDGGIGSPKTSCVFECFSSTKLTVVEPIVTPCVKRVCHMYFKHKCRLMDARLLTS
jgi:hypothetical protein